VVYDPSNHGIRGSFNASRVQDGLFGDLFFASKEIPQTSGFLACLWAREINNLFLHSSTVRKIAFAAK
jgi:hypothetical protein